MFITLKSWAHPDRAGLLLLAAAIFAAGLLTGRSLAPAGAFVATPPTVTTGAVRTGYPAQLIRVVDGDTFEARVSVWPGMDITTKIRLRGIDAPEMKARCGEEFQNAQSSREALAKILAQGEIGVTQIGQDKYGGRVLANASARNTPDVSAAMLNAGQARSYNGGRRDGWCRN